jgi:hypothetical protein
MSQQRSAHYALLLGLALKPGDPEIERRLQAMETEVQETGIE